MWMELEECTYRFNLLYNFDHLMHEDVNNIGAVSIMIMDYHY